MSGTLYTGNATLPGPSTVQLTVDNDPQRATTYDPGLQNLADMIACLRHQTYSRKGSVSDMQDVSDASIGDPFFVPGQGYYSLIPGGVWASQNPWLYDADGIGGGAQWMHDNWLVLLDQGNPAKIPSALVPWNKVVAADFFRTTNVSIADTVSGATFQNLVDVGPGPVHASVIAAISASGSPGVLADDLLKLHVGPFEMTISAGGYCQIRVHINQGTTNTYYTKIFEDSAGKYADFDITHTCLAGDITIAVEIASDGAHGHDVNSPTTWGSAAHFTWAQYELLRL